jgi:hypothetical protein
VAFIPVDGSTLGCVSIAAITFGLAYVLCQLLLVGPLFATDEHKDHQRNFGPPGVGVIMAFVGLVSAHVTSRLSQRYSSPLVGLLLPIGSTVTRALVLVLQARSFHLFYYAPKQAFLALLPPSASIAEASPAIVPPLLGDLEAIYGGNAALLALVIGNAASVATLVGAMLAPESMAWTLSLAASSLQEILTRTGFKQRLELWLARRFAAHMHFTDGLIQAAQANALELVYLHSLGGTGLVATTMALCIGCLRAANFGDPAAIVWLDVSPTVWHVLVAQIAFRMVADAIVWAADEMGLQRFELSERFVDDHPLCNTVFRGLQPSNYVNIFGIGGAVIYMMFRRVPRPCVRDGDMPQLRSERDQCLGCACTRMRERNGGRQRD